jgi:glycosyltransferase involved in cell wall biosynthesis
MPSRILAIGQFPPPVSGFSLITERYVDLMREDHEVEVHDIAAAAGCVGLRKPVSRLVRTLSACRALLRGAPTPDRCCYVACEGGRGRLYTALVIGVARLRGWRIVLHHHSFRYVDRPDRLMRFLLAIGGDLHHVFLCNLMRTRFETAYRREVRAAIVSNAAFVDPLPLDLPLAADPTLVLGHLSNLTREKGLDTFLDLLRAGLSAGLDLRGILAGPVGSPADAALIEAARIEFGDRLDYRGPVYGEAKARFYREAEVFVFPTRYVDEAQPTVLFEAAAAGHRVIALDRGCIAAQVGEDGLVVARDHEFVPPALDWLRSHAGDPGTRIAERRRIAAGFTALRALARESARSLFSPH